MKIPDSENFGGSDLILKIPDSENFGGGGVRLNFGKSAEMARGVLVEGGSLFLIAWYIEEQALCDQAFCALVSYNSIFSEFNSVFKRFYKNEKVEIIIFETVFVVRES